MVGGHGGLIVPLSFLVQDRLVSLVVVFCVGLVLYALLASIAPAIMSELFPTELRATGIGAWYNLTVAVFGGTAPLVITALSEAGPPALVLLVRGRGRGRGVLRDPHPAETRRSELR